MSRCEIITIPLGTELNCGPSEDSDSFGVVEAPIRAQIIGPLAEGAYPIHLIGAPDHLKQLTLYWHQPPSPEQR